MFSAGNQRNDRRDDLRRDELPRDDPPTERDRIDERGRSSSFELPVSFVR
jgi:hypothetical protein